MVACIGFSQTSNQGRQRKVDVSLVAYVRLQSLQMALDKVKVLCCQRTGCFSVKSEVFPYLRLRFSARVGKYFSLVILVVWTHTGRRHLCQCTLKCIRVNNSSYFVNSYVYCFYRLIDLKFRSD